jgi:phage terminase large subunit-like protein
MELLLLLLLLLIRLLQKYSKKTDSTPRHMQIVDEVQRFHDQELLDRMSIS